MKLYRVGLDLVPHVAGEFVDETAAGEFAFAAYAGGLSMKDFAFYVVRPGGRLAYWCSPCENGFSWEEPT